MNEIIVGNVGTVEQGISDLDATRIFKQYCQAVHTSSGRMAWESVTWLKDGEVFREYNPSLSVCFEGDGEDWDGISRCEMVAPFFWVKVEGLGTTRRPASCPLPNSLHVDGLVDDDPIVASYCQRQVEAHQKRHQGQWDDENEMGAIALALLLKWEWPAMYQTVSPPNCDMDDGEEAAQAERIWAHIQGDLKIPAIAVYEQQPGASWAWVAPTLRDMAPASATF